MTPKQQAQFFYKSLADADKMSCKLLVRSAQIQRGRAASLKHRFEELEKLQAPQQELDRIQAEIDRRTELAGKYEALDKVIAKAVDDRAVLDKDKFK